MVTGIAAVRVQIVGFLLAVILGCIPLAGRATSLNIVTDIAPVQALVAEIAAGMQKPRRLIPLAMTPHDFSLRPSDMRALGQADLIVWLGPQSTPALRKPLARAETARRVLTLNAVAGVQLLPLRKPGLFADRRATAVPGRPEAVDPHSWLSPGNLHIWAVEIAARMSALDAENAARYQDNLAMFLRRLTQAQRDIGAELRPPLAPFVLFHDSYQYFERAFGLVPMGALTTGDMETGSLGLMAALRNAIRNQPGACVLVPSPPQARQAAPLRARPDTRLAIVDPLGRDIAPADYTPTMLLRRIAAQMASCLRTP